MPLHAHIHTHTLLLCLRFFFFKSTACRLGICICGICVCIPRLGTHTTSLSLLYFSLLHVYSLLEGRGGLVHVYSVCVYMCMYS